MQISSTSPGLSETFRFQTSCAGGDSSEENHSQQASSSFSRRSRGSPQNPDSVASGVAARTDRTVPAQTAARTAHESDRRRACNERAIVGSDISRCARDLFPEQSGGSFLEINALIPSQGHGNPILSPDLRAFNASFPDSARADWPAEQHRAGTACRQKTRHSAESADAVSAMRIFRPAIGRQAVWHGRRRQESDTFLPAGRPVIFPL